MLYLLYMKPYRPILLALSLFYTSFSFAQDDHSVIGSAGDVFDNGNITLAFTVGEPVIETIGTGNVFLTQGFHQDRLIISTIGEAPSIQYDMRAYPNPAGAFVFFDPGGAKNLNLSLRDMKGVELSRHDVSEEVIEISLDLLPNANYLLYVSDENGSFQKAFHVQKVQ